MICTTFRALITSAHARAQDYLQTTLLNGWARWQMGIGLAVPLIFWSAPRAIAIPLKIATWNIEHLRALPNTGPNPRTNADYQR
ncbi:MAG: hypothetical protein F6K19_49880, partial [Cyanothece sp. SIO1E1]|nr:hypothetical protein [Cyanothece sp. SIO1E1]